MQPYTHWQYKFNLLHQHRNVQLLLWLQYQAPLKWDWLAILTTEAAKIVISKLQIFFIDAKCIQTFVFFLMALLRLSKFVKSTISTSTPWLRMTLLNKRFVPPYTSSPQRIWSPVLSNWVIAVVAPKPEANVRPYFPLSKAARHFSKTWRVGFPLRPYSNV